MNSQLDCKIICLNFNTYINMTYVIEFIYGLNLFVTQKT